MADPIPAGKLAAIVTSFEMAKRPRPRPMDQAPFRLSRWERPAPDRYRALFRRIGEPWLWFSRLVMTDEALNGIIHDPLVQVFAVTDLRGIEIGMLELDFTTAGECEIVYFGFIPELTRKGHGRWLMGHALALAWRKGIERVWLHSCTLDHPSALGFYRAQGFVAFRREIEIFGDPRLAGILPREAAPHIALLEADS